MLSVVADEHCNVLLMRRRRSTTFVIGCSSWPHAASCVSQLASSLQQASLCCAVLRLRAGNYVYSSWIAYS